MTKTDTSHVLVAMKLDEFLARSSLRISLGKNNTEADIDSLVTALQTLIRSKQSFGASVMR